jgi:hypothetical protein
MLLVWGIAPAQHQDISVFRSNIFELQKYLAENRIAHAIAHPLYSVNGKLTASHLERLILLFKHFEGINGLARFPAQRSGGQIAARIDAGKN